MRGIILCVVKCQGLTPFFLPFFLPDSRLIPSVHPLAQELSLVPLEFWRTSYSKHKRHRDLGLQDLSGVYFIHSSERLSLKFGEELEPGWRV
jgi:hypothetical protein